MLEKNLKNMVILKDLPSNIIQEAFIVMKTTSKARELEKTQKEILKLKEQNIDKKSSEEKYFLKEAENVVLDYITDLEKANKKNKEIDINNIKKEYRKIKIFSIVIIGIMIVENLIILLS